MKKTFQKQKALELFRTGNTYGAIAKQIDEAKSTVYRWINEEKEKKGFLIYTSVAICWLNT